MAAADAPFNKTADQADALAKQIMENTRSLCHAAMNDMFKPEELTDQVESLRSAMHQCLNAGWQATMSREAALKAMAELRQAEDEGVVAAGGALAMDELYFAERRKLMPDKPTVADMLAGIRGVKRWADYMKAFDEEVKKLTDGDVLVAEEAFDGVCPVSHRIMENPVKNSQCSHVFDKASVDQLFKGKSGLRCPVAGCSKYLRIDSFEPCLKTMKRIADMKKKAQRARAKRVASEEEEDGL